MNTIINIKKGDRIKQIKEIDDFYYVGKDFEVVNIYDNEGKENIVLRNDRKVAVASFDMDTIKECFVLSKNFNSWTDWCRFNGEDDSLYFYRTNGKKVQVKSIDKLRTESSCHKDDKFSLSLGLQLAYERMVIAKSTIIKQAYEKLVKQSNEVIKISKNNINQIIRSLDNKEEKSE